MESPLINANEKRGYLSRRVGPDAVGRARTRAGVAQRRKPRMVCLGFGRDETDAIQPLSVQKGTGRDEGVGETVERKFTWSSFAIHGCRKPSMPS